MIMLRLRDQPGSSAHHALSQIKAMNTDTGWEDLHRSPKSGGSVLAFKLVQVTVMNLAMTKRTTTF